MFDALISSQQQSPRLFHALAHPTRVALLDRLAAAPARTLELAREMPGSRFATRKHLAVLEQAGLVVRAKRGRELWNYLNAVPLQRLYERWIAPRAAAGAQQLLALEAHLTAPSDKPFPHEVPSVTPFTPTAAAVHRYELSIELAAEPERVWRALTHEIDAWWRRDFFTSSRTRRFVLEARLGGRLYEDAGDGEGLQWAQVIGIEAPSKLDLIGYIAPDFGGPATAYHCFRLKAHAEGGTQLKFTDALHGRVDDAQAQMLADGWKLLLAEGLKPYLEATP